MCPRIPLHVYPRVSGLGMLLLTTLVATVALGAAGFDHLALDSASGLVFCSSWPFEVHVLDIGNPARPARLSVFRPHGVVAELCCVNDLVYVAAGTQLDVWDLSAPETPVYVCGLESLCSPFSRLSLATAGAYLYVGGDSLLRVVDITNPRSPREAGRVRLTSYVIDVAAIGEHAYVVVGAVGLWAVDASSPRHPKVVVRGADIGHSLVEAAGTHVYSRRAPHDELDVIDVSDPGNPTVTGRFHDRAILTQPGGRIAFADSHAFVPNRADGLVIIDVSAPATPREVGHLAAPRCISDVAVASGYAYVADSDSGLLVVDVTSPRHPRRVGQYALPAPSVQQPVSPREQQLDLEAVPLLPVLFAYGVAVVVIAGVFLLSLWAAGEPRSRGEPGDASSPPRRAGARGLLMKLLLVIGYLSLAVAAYGFYMEIFHNGGAMKEARTLGAVLRHALPFLFPLGVFLAVGGAVARRDHNRGMRARPDGDDDLPGGRTP